MKNTIIAAVTALSVLGGAVSYTAAPLSCSLVTASAAGCTYTEQDGITYSVYEDHAELKLADSAVSGTVVIPEAIEGQPVTVIGKEAFRSSAGSITDIKLPDTVRVIGDRAFACTGIKTIDLPDQLSDIGDRAFEGSSLMSISIPGSVGYLRDNIFNGCMSLERVVFEEGILEIPDYMFNYGYAITVLTEIILPEGLKYIGDGAFRCSSIKEIRIPGSVEYIGMEAFEYCQLLEKVVIGEGVEALSDEVFQDCGRLWDVSLPSTLKRIGNDSFRSCSSLKNIAFPDSLGSIGYAAFSFSGLEYAEIPGSVTEIGDYAFENTDLSYVRVPGSVTYLGDSAFGGCYRLNDVIICNPSCDIYFTGNTIQNSDDWEKLYTGTIYGYEGSTAQVYAEGYDYRFRPIGTEPEPPAPHVSGPQWEVYYGTLGDLNFDGYIDAADASMILEYYAYTSTGGIRTIDNYFSDNGINGDMDGDGFIDSGDATLVLEIYAAGSTGGGPEEY